jgi:cobaltochelatase CobS
MLDMCEALGLSREAANALRQSQHVALFNVAKANPSSARALALRLATRPGMPPIIPAATPAPAAGQPAPVDTGAIAALAAAEAARIVLDDTRPRLDAMAAELTSIKSAAPLLVTVALATPGNPSPAPSAPMLAHALFPRVVKLCQSPRISPLLVGPAGSGKSKLAEQVAEALGLPFFEAAKVQSEFALLGFINATGQVVRTPFREAWEHGGMFFLDEIDASNPSALTALNGALANTICPFPDMNVKRHPNFRCIAAANTIGTGATRQYVGRNPLDGATRDRFYFVQMEYDLALERALAPVKAWGLLIQAIRVEAAALGWQVIISPRATIAGGLALLAGETVTDALNATALKDLDGEQQTKLFNRLYLPEHERAILSEIDALSNPILSAVA